MVFIPSADAGFRFSCKRRAVSIDYDQRAQPSAVVTHPDVVQVHDAGRHGSEALTNQFVDAWIRFPQADLAALHKCIDVAPKQALKVHRFVSECTSQ
jgi:hypothetical protein